MSKPREWVIVIDHDNDEDAAYEVGRISVVSKGIHVIEKSAYDDLKEKYDELLSYMPKLPTTNYEKDLAAKLEVAIGISKKLLKNIPVSFMEPQYMIEAREALKKLGGEGEG